MVPLLKSFARQILPERVTVAARVLFRRLPIAYSGRYSSYAAAARHATGYADPVIFETTRKAALAVKRGEAAFEHGGVARRTPNYSWAALTSLQHAAITGHASPQRPLHVVDFGGSLGALYFKNRRFLEAIPLLWSIVEQPHYVACGNAEFADARLAFFSSIAEAAARAPVDAILFASSLEYSGAPYDLLTEAAALRPAFIIITGTHLSDGAEDEFRVQRLYAPLHPASLAMRYVSKRKLIEHMEAIGYAPIAAFDQGYLLQRKPEIGDLA